MKNILNLNPQIRRWAA